MGYFGIPFRNGVPIGLGSVASFGAQQFDPSSLFIGGTVGTFYDPSDPTTLFTTSTGTTPCAVPGSGSQVLVGLMLDKSQGAPGALGAELVTTPYSGSTSGTWAISSTSITRNSSATGQASLSLSISVDTTKRYLVSFTVANLSGDTFFYRIGGGGTAYQITSNGVYTARVLGGGTASSIIFAPWAGSAGEATITNISVREIPGNHAIAFNDTTARPELSARVNLLTYSEQFDNAAWVATNSSIVSNAAIAPNGTLTAEKLVENTANSTHQVYQNYASPIANTSLTFSIFARAAERTVVTLLEPFAAERTFNLVSGVATGSGASMRDVGNGWWQCIATGLVPDTANRSYAIRLNNGSGTTYTGDGTSGIFIWGADLRPANIGSAIPSYQRIADQYTYDSNGFPSYLRFDGVDDSMYTPASINFSGTDKMSVFAGVRKLSDAVYPVIAELAFDYSANNGSFALFASGNSTPRYGFYLRGSANTGYEPQTYEAPLTNVLAVSYDIGGAAKANEVLPRINSVLNQTNPVSGADAGTGNFGTYPLYIGSRNNSSLRFNGHLYSLIIAGTQLQSGSITATEQYVAGKTGVQI